MTDSSHEPSTATSLQIAANRRNALKSTGPRTQLGKSVSRINSLKHGLSAEHVVLFDEEVAEFEQFFREWMHACKPQGFVEQQLVERIAICAWRLRRVYRIETGLFIKYHADWIKGATGVPVAIETTFFRASTAENTLEKLTHYECSIEHSLRRALRQLDELKNVSGLSPLARHNAISASPRPRLSRKSQRRFQLNQYLNRHYRSSTAAGKMYPGDGEPFRRMA